MSNASPVIGSINGETRRIYLKQGIVDYYPIEDIYHEYRTLRRNTESLRKWAPLLLAEGNKAKGKGAFTPRYVMLLDGTKIVPYDEPDQLNQLGDMITDDPDTDDTLYDVSGLTTAKPIFIKPSESETIQLNSESIVYSSFAGGVWVDESSEYSDEGTATFPNGNAERPVNNIPLARIIMTKRGFKKLFIKGNYTLDTGDNVEYIKIEGDNPILTTLTINTGALTAGATVEEAKVTGTLDGGITLRKCLVDGINYVNGFIYNCVLTEKPIILANNLATAFIMRCESGYDKINAPIIDCGGDGPTLIIKKYAGNLILKNKTGANNVDIDLDSGSIRLDLTTMSSGTVTVRGDGSVVDDATGNLLLSGNHNGVNLVNETSSAIGRYAERMIFIDTELATDGDGTSKRPFNSFANALDFAELEGIRKLILFADATVDRVLKNFVVIGVGTPSLDCNGYNLDKSEFEHLELKGIYTGKIKAYKCDLFNGFRIYGKFNDCGLGGDLICIGNSKFNNCSSDIAGLNKPSLSINEFKISVRSYSGGLLIKDCNDPLAEVTVEMSQGKLYLENTCSNGVLSARGIAYLDNQATSGCEVDTDALIEPIQVLNAQDWARKAGSQR